MGKSGLNSTDGKSTKVKSTDTFCHVLSRFFVGLRLQWQILTRFVTFCHVLIFSKISSISTQPTLGFSLHCTPSMAIWMLCRHVCTIKSLNGDSYIPTGPKRLSNPLSLSSVEDSSSKTSASSGGTDNGGVPSTCSWTNFPT